MDSFQSKKNKYGLYGFEAYLEHRYLLRKCLIWILDGKSVNSLHDCWMEDPPLVDKINTNMSLYIVKKLL